MGAAFEEFTVMKNVRQPAKADRPKLRSRIAAGGYLKAGTYDLNPLAGCISAAGSIHVSHCAKRIGKHILAVVGRDAFPAATPC